MQSESLPKKRNEKFIMRLKNVFRPKYWWWWWQQQNNSCLTNEHRCFLNKKQNLLNFSVIFVRQTFFFTNEWNQGEYRLNTILSISLNNVHNIMKQQRWFFVFFYIFFFGLVFLYSIIWLSIIYSQLLATVQFSLNTTNNLQFIPFIHFDFVKKKKTRNSMHYFIE